MSIPQPPSADQLAAARLAHWRQNSAEGADASAVALLTLESARRFVSTCGLVLFAPRPQHIASPAPSLVEATLGSSNAAPTLAESAEARTLLARLIAEGSAVPLNLLGAPSTTPDAPDFVASAATFPYIFTLRGDKAWKQPPSTSGASKVSPLALNTYTLLLENGPTSAYDLVTQLGKEVTEAAVLRSLNELWQHLRVLPVPQADGGATLWETVANRFTKQLKAGANAGQPSALSALISLYLSQALLATETEIETFLSPLAPRSRVRDVLHALTGARQIETVAVDGKTHLHIHGELPTFSSSDRAADPAVSDSDEQPDSDTSQVELADDGSRIKKFVPKPRKIGTGYIERAKPFGANARPAREGRPLDRKGPPRDRESRPFTRPAGARPAAKFGAPDRPSRPAFNKPWDEEKQQRIRRESAPAVPPVTGSDGEQFQTIDLDAGSPAPSARASFPKRPFASKARFGGDRPAFTRRPSSDGGDRPAYSRSRDSDASTRPPRRDFAPREGADARPPRREFSGAGKPSFGDRKPFPRSKFGADKREGFTPRPSGDRPAPGDRERRPFRRDDSSGEGRPPRRDFAPRSEGSGRPPRRDFAPRADDTRSNYSKPRTFRDRPDGESQGSPARPERPAFRKFDAPRAPRKPFPPREDGDSRPPRREFSGPGKPSFGPRKPFVRSSSSEGAPPREGGYPPKRDGGYAGKREGAGYAGKKPFGSKPGGFAGKKPFGAKPSSKRPVDAPGASTFDKFKGGNKPWGKRPPGRKPKPDRGEA